MPNWSNYYFSYEATPTNFVGTGTSTSSSIWDTPFTATQIQQLLEQEMLAMEQTMRKAEEQYHQEMERKKELAEDKKKYPLFFLKEGIV